MGRANKKTVSQGGPFRAAPGGITDLQDLEVIDIDSVEVEEVAIEDIEVEAAPVKRVASTFQAAAGGIADSDEEKTKATLTKKIFLKGIQVLQVTVDSDEKYKIIHGIAATMVAHRSSFSLTDEDDKKVYQFSDEADLTEEEIHHEKMEDATFRFSGYLLDALKEENKGQKIGLDNISLEDLALAKEWHIWGKEDVIKTAKELTEQLGEEVEAKTLGDYDNAVELIDDFIKTQEEIEAEAESSDDN